ncbi:DNA gyrase subunit B, putative [Plasmodium ovale]|uniref:DNA topoisomerase 2 n=2 Tax=Plasmodium ovale TaxID=36330 RepID=A0A1A8X005_PLAOA|nr:DNA gyrase subunit B, putative (GyrB) [Plasmodium ovale curtisi]SBS98574.1 DNA gyrase subunit B, putative (GyrB) [Plasmodium ovale curtisi]SCQ17206.1 DNA gyrase subunit B, putative [Plasmodium ovale]
MKIRLIKSLSLFLFFVKYSLLHTPGKAHYPTASTSKRCSNFTFCRGKLNIKTFSLSPTSKFVVVRSKGKTHKKRRYGFVKNFTQCNPVREGKWLEHNKNRNVRCKNYEAKDIVILEGLEAVRKRPGMYIGNTDVKGLHQILFEIIDNSVDEYNNFECNEIKIIIHNDESVTIEDNGRGIPCDIHEKTKKSALETVLTVLHSGAKFLDDDAGEVEEMGEEIGKKQSGAKAKEKTGGSSGGSDSGCGDRVGRSELESAQKYKFSSGLHGVGLSVANALSSFMKVDVFRDNKIYSIELEKGKVVKGLSVCACPLKKRGTRIWYKPDSTIFKNSIKHNAEMVKNRIHQLAYLNDKLTFYFYDDRVGNKVTDFMEKGVRTNEMVVMKNKENKNDYREPISEYVENFHYDNLDSYNYEVIKHEGGLNEYMEILTKNKTNLFKENDKIISISCSQKNIYVELKMKWVTNQYNEHILSFVNNVNTTDGGTHVDALKHAVSRCVNFNIKKNELTKNFVNISGEYIREGLIAILSVKMSNPEFEGQTKTKLGSYYLKSILENIIFEKLSEIFDFEPNILNSIYVKALQAKLSDEEAKAARDLIRSKNNQYYSTILPGKLVDCISDDISKNEIFIVEGDSAAGSAKQARNREIQAILPLKGKILNVEKIKNNKKIFENIELKSLITAIGLSVNYDNMKNSKMSTFLNKKKKDIKKKYELKNSKNENILSNSSMLNKKKNNLIENPLRYGKIIIMTDADVDGEHIRILLLTFLYRFQKEIIEKGNVYVACPPLYKITYSKFFDNSIKDTITKRFNVSTKNSKYIIHTYSDAELNDLLRLLDKDKVSTFNHKHSEKRKEEYVDTFNDEVDEVTPFLNEHIDRENFYEWNSNMDKKNVYMDENKSSLPLGNNALFTFSKKYEIQRFKGLGEMMADQLWCTTMDPRVRKLIRVTVNDAIKANNLINSLMGEDSKLRKHFILKNSNSISV